MLVSLSIFNKLKMLSKDLTIGLVIVLLAAFFSAGVSGWEDFGKTFTSGCYLLLAFEIIALVDSGLIERQHLRNLIPCATQRNK